MLPLRELFISLNYAKELHAVIFRIIIRKEIEVEWFYLPIYSRRILFFCIFVLYDFVDCAWSKQNVKRELLV